MARSHILECIRGDCSLGYAVDFHINNLVICIGCDGKGLAGTRADCYTPLGGDWAIAPRWCSDCIWSHSILGNCYRLASQGQCPGPHGSARIGRSGIVDRTISCNTAVWCNEQPGGIRNSSPVTSRLSGYIYCPRSTNLAERLTGRRNRISARRRSIEDHLIGEIALISFSIVSRSSHIIRFSIGKVW